MSDFTKDEIKTVIEPSIQIIEETMKLLTDGSYLKELARFIHKFRDELIEVGFTNEEAFQLLKEYKFDGLKK